MANEQRLIDANALAEQVKSFTGMFTDGLGFVLNLEVVLRGIESAPTVDAVEVVHGHWVSDKADILFHCSVCETQISTDWDYDDLAWNYCPNCGAKMDGGTDDGIL